MIYALLDVTGILIAIRFVINSHYIWLISHYITSDRHDGPIGLDRYLN